MLLLHGADTKARDSQGRTPEDLTREIPTNTGFKRELLEYLEEPSCWFEYFTRKNGPMRKEERTRYALWAQALILLATFSMVHMILFSDISVHYFLSRTTNAFFGATCLLFIMAWWKDPGYVVKDKNLDF